ncbi:MAG TPA: hypothetical protein G4O00_10005 [Thermoflexia bacterium]|jgi:hypothetical protein|nr:hypothetical protein [Thermoflexia bacterium]
MKVEHHSAQEIADFPALLRVLTPAQVLEIDRALEAIGPFGEVRLVKVKGRLRFIQQMESRDLLGGGRGGNETGRAE